MDPTNQTPPPAAPALTTIEDIRAHPKLVEEYNDAERQVILDNKDQLTDDEKWAFGPITGEIVPPPSSTPPTEEGAAPVTPEPTPATPATTEPAAPAAPPAPATPEPTPFSFKSQEEMDAYIQKSIDDKKTADDAAAKETTPKEPVKVFDEDWKPKDANELATALLANPVFGQALKEAVTPAVLEELATRNQAQRTAAKEFNERLDSEYTDLATKNNLPALNTPEGQEVNKQIATLAVAHGKDNYYDAYDLWSIIPKDKGGGLEVGPATPAVDPAKAAAEAAKAAAAKVGSGAGAEDKSGADTRPDYKTTHESSMTQLIERALK